NRLVSNKLSVLVPNEFTKTWLEQHYTKVINTILLEKTGVELSVKFLIEDEELVEEKEEIAIEEAKKQIVNNNDLKHMLNPKYTFDTFVVGYANRFAHSAAIDLAEYNA